MNTEIKNTDANAIKEEFDLHVAHITDIHKGFIENTAKVAGFLLLALGWLATSTSAREHLVNEPTMAAVAAIAVVCAYSLSVTASWVAYVVSRKTERRLNELAHLPPSAYTGRVLGPITFTACVAATGALSGLLVIALLSIK